MVLVTGSNSLLGTRLVAKLAGAGEKVRCLDMEKPENLPAGVEFFDGDILDAMVLGKVCKGVDAVFHVMDVKSPKHFGRRYMRRINIKGTRMLLRAANAAGIKRMIFVSTYEVYGTVKNLPLGENDIKIMKPITRYGKDKLRAEKICQEYVNANKMAVTMFRPAPMVGPGTRNSIVLISLLMAMVKTASRFSIPTMPQKQSCWPTGRAPTAGSTTSGPTMCLPRLTRSSR